MPSSVAISTMQEARVEYTQPRAETKGCSTLLWRMWQVTSVTFMRFPVA
jgi:hypothetical protein